MMDTNKRILMVGKYCGKAREWHVPPPPVEEMKPTLLVSDWMNGIGARGTQDDLWWDGYNAQCEGQPLAAMPTEQHEVGWWAARARWGEAESSRYDGSIEDDADFIRHGGA